MLNNKENIINNIVKSLIPLGPYKIILFGSYSKGNISDESDIDLYVVLNNDNMPSSYDEKIKYKILVRNAILDISKKNPIDLIVHTKPMYEKFKTFGSLFSKEILTKGKILYESNF